MVHGYVRLQGPTEPQCALGAPVSELRSKPVIEVRRWRRGAKTARELDARNVSLWHLREAMRADVHLVPILGHLNRAATAVCRTTVC
jgi:hypothetical protein